MKPLTKDDFSRDDEYPRYCLSIQCEYDDFDKIRNQILKNQEDAKEYWKIIDEFVRLNKLEERLKKLPIGLILQHIRDSFAYDKKDMGMEAQKKTVKCIEDLMELQKLLEVKE